MDHLLYKADNLDALKDLLSTCEGKINFIYIDPPYNTGNTFTYNDRLFSSNDRHSAWLSFMKERLLLAQKLLSPEGTIFISIGQDELYRLKILCDDIFGEDNFINNFMWLCGKGKKDTYSRTLQQDTLCYAKDKTHLAPFTEIETTQYETSNPDADPRGSWFSGSISFSEKRSNPKHKNYFSIQSPSGIKWERQWFVSKEEMDELLSQNKIYFGPAPDYSNVPRRKIFNGESSKIIPKNLIDHCPTTRAAQNYVDELLGVKGIFDNPKPVELIHHFMTITNCPKDALILDFFAGSGTTFEATVRMNKSDGGSRKCILIQKDEPTFEMDGEIKTAKPGSREAFENGYMSIFEICKARADKVCEMENLPHITVKEL